MRRDDDGDLLLRLLFLRRLAFLRGLLRHLLASVSYTHLTLPTSDLV